jgi:hypothetical protein
MPPSFLDALYDIDERYNIDDERYEEDFRRPTAVISSDAGIRNRAQLAYRSAESARIATPIHRRVPMIPPKFWMLFAMPTIPMTGSNVGCARIPAKIPAPRTLFADEATARIEAAKLAEKLNTRVYVLASGDSCAPPPPAPPDVVWESSNVLEAPTPGLAPAPLGGVK